jgi:RHS repeat-associated protein
MFVRNFCDLRARLNLCLAKIPSRQKLGNFSAGCPGLDFQTWDWAYDVRPTIMTLSATCAILEVTPSPSYYRAEQYDSDLGLYYLRARYYNPLTGRFLSRDPEDGWINVPATLHKYLYVGGDPVNWWDPTGRDEEEYGEEISLAEKINCVLDTAADLLDVVSSPDALSGAGAVVSLVINLSDCKAALKKVHLEVGGPLGGWPMSRRVNSTIN